MNNKLYVGNLGWEVTEDDLRNLFTPAGTILKAVIITDRETGKSRGFGFVEMSSNQEAEKAIQLVHGTSLVGRRVIVKEAENDGRIPSELLKQIAEYVNNPLPAPEIKFTFRGRSYILKCVEIPVQESSSNASRKYQTPYK